MPNMKAILLLYEKYPDAYGNTVEMKIWSVPHTELRPHCLKYSLVYVVDNCRVVGYDNETGKGDHKHIDGIEYPYQFESPSRLRNDFFKDIQAWKEKRYGDQS